MRFLDRQTELARLERLARRRDGGLAVIWGRRRVGKTRLLVEWCRSAGGTYFVADESAASIQRRRLADALSARLPGFAAVEYPHWSSLFDRLAHDAARARARGPFVLDELPYLVVASPELPSVLQRFVDHGGKEARLTLALAGSSQRMMQGLVLASDTPLFGRATEAFEVKPLPPGLLHDVLHVRDPVDVVRAFAVWGGIPRYWELAAEHRSLRDAVDALVLDPAGILADEPVRLLREELPPATALRPVLDAIGSGAHRLGEIGGRLGTPATALSRPMARLAELGFVVRETPFGEPERSTKRALYRLADPFLRLWFALVAPKRALLAQVPRAARLALFDERAPHLVAATWEAMCRAAVPLLGWGFGPAKRYWSGSGPEWDVVAESLDGNRLLVGESKWTVDATAASITRMHAALDAKGRPPMAGERAVLRVLFVPSPPRRVELPRDVRVVGAREVVAALSRVAP